ncbi:hypothetical protein G7Y89_g1076 [Cudoniella acicularis]|uniref:Uncharacterized protein n=1 Tax=Cudoniella acicularis TaxID=354080 RepID=A0A8H4RWT2_9HELO|nr:hypothetical protein G7Y89_g1076 [Cudoniella acicularis]
MDHDQVSSQTPFLDGKVERYSSESEYERIPRAKRSWLKRNPKQIVLNFLLIVTSPARGNLEYVRMEMDTAGDHRNKYMGFTETADEAWTELMSRNNIRLTEEDLKAINQTSVSLGGGGYLGMLSVYHELHCVKMIRWAFNKVRYLDRWSEQDVIDLPVHIDHCLDIVRQSIQCRADTTIITYWWTDKSRVPETDFYGEHECINWDMFEAWADQHTVDIYVPGELNHPKYAEAAVRRGRMHSFFHDLIAAFLTTPAHFAHFSPADEVDEVQLQ